MVYPREGGEKIIKGVRMGEVRLQGGRRGVAGRRNVDGATRRGGLCRSLSA